MPFLAIGQKYRKRIGDIGLQFNTCRSKWLRCSKRTVGHGLGTELHEAAKYLTMAAGNGPRLVDGMVLAIEPMINQVLVRSHS